MRVAGLASRRRLLVLAVALLLAAFLLAPRGGLASRTTGDLALATGVLFAPASDTYRIVIHSPGLTRVQVDGRDLTPGRGATEVVDVALVAGPHDIRLEAAGDVTRRPVALEWFVGSPHRPVPIPLTRLSGRPLSAWQWRWLAATPALVLVLTLAWTLAVLYGVWRVVRTTLPGLADTASLPAVRLTAVGCGVIFVTGIWWGAGPSTWALDELAPAGVIAAWNSRFSGGWHDVYPPFHFMVLALAWLPSLLAGELGIVRLTDTSITTSLLLVGRLISTAAAMGIVTITAALTARVAGPPTAWIGGLIAGLTLPLSFYAKTMNLEAAYVFWVAASMLCLAAALETGRRRDLVAYGVTAALAIATKDQAYGLYLLPSLWLAWRTWRAGRSLGALAVGAAVGAVTFALAHNLPFNLGGFEQHIAAALGPASANYRTAPATVAGAIALAGATAGLLPWLMGWAGLVATTAALSSAESRSRLAGAWAWLVLPALSYLLTFIIVAGYVYDRFLLPVAVPLAVVAALGLRRSLDGWPSRRIGPLAAIGVLVWMLWRAVSLDVWLLRDGRTDAEHWLRASLQPGATVGFAQQLVFLPRLDEFATVDVEPVVSANDAGLPDVIVVNVDHLRRDAPGTPRRQWLAWLESPDGPYVTGYRARTPLPWWSAFRWTTAMTDQAESPFTNLDKANPEIAIFQKR